MKALRRPQTPIVFMAGFFLVFSFFKFLNLDGFADSYAMYDVVALKFKAWGYIYALIELSLGIAYAANLNPVHVIIAAVIGVAIFIGVLVLLVKIAVAS